MKKLFFLFLLFLCSACEEDKTIDPTLMPEPTTSGYNTFGCLIDGWVYTGERFGKPEASAYSNEQGHYVTIKATVDQYTELEFTLVNPKENAECTYTDAALDGKKLEEGKAYITRNDEAVISGTFSGGIVTKGRFDIRYNADSARE